MKRLFLSLLGLLVASCAVNLAPNTPESRAVDLPTLNEVVKKEVGDTIVEQEDSKTFPSAVFSSDFKASLAAAALIFRGGKTYIGSRLYQGSVAYCGPGATCGGLNNCTEVAFNGVCFIPSSATEIKVFGKFGIETVPVPSDLIRFDRSAATSDSAFKRHIVYTGKSGNVLHMSYREFKGDLARPAFTRDLVFDLGESRIIGFRGARFEVINADNVSITYKMLANFSDRQK